MNQQKGRMTIVSFLITIILVYGGFAAFKYFKSFFFKKDVAKEVHDTLGAVRGGGFTSERGEETVNAVLQRNGITPIEVSVHVGGGEMSYHYRFELVTDYLFFKDRETVDESKQMASYGEI